MPEDKLRLTVSDRRRVNAAGDFLPDVPWGGMEEPCSVDPTKEHHIWCNFSMRPREGCHQCEGLWKNYPYEDAQGEGDLMKKHFPENVRRV